MNRRAFVLFVSCAALTACHENKIVRLEVFEDHVAIDGVRSDLPIQEAADAQAPEHKGYVLLVPRPPLSKARLDELKRCMDKLYPGAETKIRRVQAPDGAGN
jgi:hypothetical protein